jgi:hypothetical protein
VSPMSYDDGPGAGSGVRPCRARSRGTAVSAVSADGEHRVGALSMVVLALVVEAAILVARHPARVRAFAAWWGERAPLPWVCAQIQPGDAGRRPRLVRRLAPAQVAGLALTAGLVAVFALAALFACLLDREGIAAVDRSASAWVALHRDAVLTAMLRVLIEVGSPVSVSVLAMFVCAGLAWTRRSSFPMVVGAVGAGGIGLVIGGVKALVGRDRPPMPFDVLVSDRFSLSSGHVTGTTVIARLRQAALRWQSEGDRPERELLEEDLRDSVAGLTVGRNEIRHVGPPLPPPREQQPRGEVQG